MPALLLGGSTAYILSDSVAMKLAYQPVPATVTALQRECMWHDDGDTAVGRNGANMGRARKTVRFACDGARPPRPGGTRYEERWTVAYRFRSRIDGQDYEGRWTRMNPPETLFEDDLRVGGPVTVREHRSRAGEARCDCPFTSPGLNGERGDVMK
ncbi:hypothetical protein AAW00_09745 [Aurantiacibacter luteus]|uniref:Uncharacterized protein n=1 Tax=Aurantiacibacter luteus TaxID=1581420 RepID=A0A0G9MUU0_9SPHN|nr:hypothetical protein AAW00_09745 [Aurantiacibacter luteus]